MSPKYTDLKLIDELLIDMRESGETFEHLEYRTSVTRDAMQRLREAWTSGEMPVITLSLARYFGGGKTKNRRGE